MIWVFFVVVVILFFSQDAQRGGTLSDLGKQGEVLGTQAAQAPQDWSWPSFPLLSSWHKAKIFSLGL